TSPSLSANRKPASGRSPPSRLLARRESFLAHNFRVARQTGSGCESIFASRLIRISAATEWTCSSTGWTDKCFAVPRRLCPVRRDRSWPCSAPQPASTSPPVQNANSHSERTHRRTIVPHRRISCEQRRCDQDHSLEQR